MVVITKTTNAVFRLRSRGAKVFLATNSDYTYTNVSEEGKWGGGGGGIVVGREGRERQNIHLISFMSFIYLFF